MLEVPGVETMRFLARLSMNDGCSAEKEESDDADTEFPSAICEEGCRSLGAIGMEAVSTTNDHQNNGGWEEEQADGERHTQCWFKGLARAAH